MTRKYWFAATVTLVLSALAGFAVAQMAIWIVSYLAQVYYQG